MSVASKNIFDLLGNDEDEAPQAPVKTVEKKSTHTSQRNSDGRPPAHKSGGAPHSNNRKVAQGGNDAAFRDRNAGSDRNRDRGADFPHENGAQGGRDARMRGGRGGRYPRDRDDRHSKSAPHGGTKQTELSWGATEGEAELKDEQAGEVMAQNEQSEAAAEGEWAAEGGAEADAPPGPEEKQMTFDDYLVQQAEKKLVLESEAAISVRRANEGAKENKKWANAKPLLKDEDDSFMTGSGGKVKRERERKVKQLVELENRYIEPERPRGGRGGRGGGRGRGGGGGDRGGDWEGRRDYRGGRGRGGDGGQSINTQDENAFPSLGGK